MSLINDAQIIERILRHIGMWVSEVWNNGVRRGCRMELSRDIQ